MGFNGERPDPITGHYLLGNGYRAFNPVLMRFNSPDSWSPFGEGGLNAYGYCVGDPVNRSDPTGHFANPWKGLLNLLKLRTPSMARASQAYKMASQKPQYRPQASAPISTSGSASASIYSSAGAESSSGLPSQRPSSGYAHVQSYSSIDASLPPPLPHRPPPGSSRSGSHFSTQNPQRIPSGRTQADVQNWVSTTSNLPDRELEISSQIPRAGSTPHNIYRLKVQARGVKIEQERLKSFDRAYQPVRYMNKNGVISFKYKRTEIRHY